VEEAQRRAALMPRPANQPARAKPTPSAYLVFCSAKRAELQNANPTATFTDLGKMFGQIWATYTAEEKSIYVEQANLLKLQQKQQQSDLAAAAVAAAESSGNMITHSSSSSSAAVAGIEQGHHHGLVDVSLDQLEDPLVDGHLEE